MPFSLRDYLARAATLVRELARRHRRPHGGIDSHIRPYPLLRVDDRASFTMENRRTSLRRELHTALLARRILVFYQPVVEFARDRVIRFEALPQWNNDRFGWIKSDELITLAEFAGPNFRIGRSAITSSMSGRAYMARTAAGGRPCFVRPLTRSDVWF